MASPDRTSAADRQAVSIDGHRLILSSLDKVLYPATGTTKAEILAYLATVAPQLIQWAADRPATRKRWVHGVGTEEEPGLVFYERHLDPAAPAWLPRRTVQHKDHDSDYPLVNDLATLTWLGQMGVLEIHVPQWRFDDSGVPRHPDRMVLDLDPGEGAGLAECAEVAGYARVLLDGMGLASVPVTSGSKGLHVYAALDGRYSSEEVTAVARELARALATDHRDLVVGDMKKRLRPGKVLVDWSQNNAHKTTICPYSLRGRFAPTVAAPRTWEEIEAPGLTQLDLAQVTARVEAGLIPELPPDPSSRRPDALTLYRQKRDPARTPEPVPADPPPATDGHSFVIHEHHARRLHYDFRLERDGVLVSWAVPKGVPSTAGRNNLAVQTEDHPLEYGSFAGTIPAGEYGAGQVLIWDSGSYDLEKWEDHVITVTLHGAPGGGLGAPARVSLIRTGGPDARGAPQWLLHLHQSTAEEGLRPMLATSGTAADLDPDQEWDFEIKWDGIRALAVVTPDSVRLTSRNDIDLTGTYPELEALRPLGAAGEVVLDGEIVALNRAGRPDFGLLQTRMNLTKAADVEAARRRTAVHYMVFDLLRADGESLLRRPLERRRELLAERLAGLPEDLAAVVPLSPLLGGTVSAAVEASLELGLEGVMAKLRSGFYLPGKRSRSWIKIKNSLTQEVIIGGWRPGQGNRADTLGSLLLGLPGNGRLRYIGRVGTGFDDAQLALLRARLDLIASPASPLEDVPPEDAADAHWVSPALVAEVAFTGWTGEGRLRHAVWRGLRPDKSAGEVTLEG